jgi:diacylglycerol O-acyltransferase
VTDPDRLSALDASFLALDTPTAPLHVGWTMRFAGSAPSLAELRRHVEERLHLVPRFRRRVVRPALGLGPAYWEDAPGFTIDAHVHAVTAPAPGGAAALRDVAGVLLSFPLAPHQPLWRVFLVDLGEEGFALVGQVHHALVDGIAAMEVALLLFGPAPPGGAPEPWRPFGIPHPLPSPQRAISGSAHLALELARGLKDIRPGSLRDAAAALEVLTRRGPSTSLQANGTHRREVATAEAGFDGVRAAGRRHGATVNDVLLAACTLALGGALRRRGEAPAGLKVLIPVNVRGDASPGALGNRVSLVTVELPVAERDPIAALRRVRDRTRAVKAADATGSLDALSRAADWLPGPAQRTLARALAGAADYAAVISNVPGPPVELGLLGRPLRALFPSVPVPAGCGLTIGCISYAGRLHVGLTADAEVVPDLRAVAQDLEAAFDVLRVEAPVAPTPWRARARRRRGGTGAGAQRATSR